MHARSSKTLTLLGGVATLALGSTFMLRLSAPKAKRAHGPCAPRLLGLERSVCEPLPGRVAARAGELAFSAP